MFLLLKLGVLSPVDTHGRADGRELLEACLAAEREMATTPGEAPICEWEVQRVQLPLDLPLLLELGILRSTERRGQDSGLSRRMRAGVTLKSRRLVLSKVWRHYGTTNCMQSLCSSRVLTKSRMNASATMQIYHSLEH